MHGFIAHIEDPETGVAPPCDPRSVTRSRLQILEEALDREAVEHSSRAAFVGVTLRFIARQIPVLIRE